MTEGRFSSLRSLRLLMYSVLVFVLLLVTWICLSGLMDPFHLGLGVISCLLVTWMSSDLLFSDRKVGIGGRVRQAIGWLGYLPWLLWQILLANVQILRLVLSPNLAEKIEPSIVKVKTPLKSDFEKFLLANSITLTPGTVTARVVGDDLYVHAITREAAEGLDGKMDARIGRIFGTDTQTKGGAS